LIDAHTVAGYPWYPLNAGSAPALRTSASADPSISFVVTPGVTIDPSSAKIRATS
jgi:hypothetical protein